MKNKVKFKKKFFETACTKCGFCQNIYPENFQLKKNTVQLKDLDELKYKNLKSFCPGFGFDYSQKEKDFKFDNLIGPYYSSYISHSLNSEIRGNAASGGVLTEILIYLLETKKIDFIIMPIKNDESQIFPKYSITNDISLVKSNSQSIYTKIPATEIFDKLIENKKYCFVGLPDQNMALRKIMDTNKNIKNKIELLVGPMVGINMDRDSLNGIKKIYNIDKDNYIKSIQWRAGEWPGYLHIKFSDNYEIKIKKFYYNFLLPFYCSHETLLSSDFSNEAADISVGDAWSPKYEAKGGGWSVVWSKNKTGDQLLNDLSNKIFLQKISAKEAKSMHLHMLDFKKRGSQYRRQIYKFFNFPVPNNQTKIVEKKLSRYLIEIIIIFIIWSLRSNFGKFILKISSPNFLGIIFAYTRLIWKKITYKSKREGINDF